MKTFYIPAGERVAYASLYTEHLVLNGCLTIARDLRAKTISGTGVICAGSISADEIRMDELEAASITCAHLLAKRVVTPELVASESAAVSSYLSAAMVRTKKLTVAVSEVDQVVADQVIHLPAKRRGLLRLLLASSLRSFWMNFGRPRWEDDWENDVEDTPEGEESASPETVSPQETAPTDCDTGDEELNRIVNLFKLTREAGYTLKLVPGTPEANAPVFDFEQERIVRPVA